MASNGSKRMILAENQKASAKSLNKKFENANEFAIKKLGKKKKK